MTLFPSPTCFLGMGLVGCKQSVPLKGYQMTIYFGWYTVAGLFIGAGAPFLLVLLIHILNWIEIHKWNRLASTRSHAENRANPMSRSAHLALFNSQYYPDIPVGPRNEKTNEPWFWIQTTFVLLPLVHSLHAMLLMGSVGVVLGLIVDNFL